MTETYQQRTARQVITETGGCGAIKNDRICIQPKGHASRCFEEDESDAARIKQLEDTLRTCITPCADCGEFAVWTVDCPSRFGFRPGYCSVCKKQREHETFEDGRYVGQLRYSHWQWLDRNIELAKIFSRGATEPTPAPECPQRTGANALALVVTNLCDMRASARGNRITIGTTTVMPYERVMSVLRQAINYIEGRECFPDE